MKTVMDEYNNLFQTFFRYFTYFLGGIFLFIPNPIIEYAVTGDYNVIFAVRADLYFMLFLFLSVYGFYHYPKILFPSEILFYQVNTGIIVHRGHLLSGIEKIVVEEIEYESEGSEINWDIRLIADNEMYHIFDETGYKTSVNGIKATFLEVANDLQIEFEYKIRNKAESTEFNHARKLLEKISPDNRHQIDINKAYPTTKISTEDDLIVLNHKNETVSSLFNFNNVFAILYFGSMISMFISFMSVLEIRFFDFPFPFNIGLELSGYFIAFLIIVQIHNSHNREEIKISINDEKIQINSVRNNKENMELIVKNQLADIRKMHIDGTLNIQFIDTRGHVIFSIPLNDNQIELYNLIQQTIYTKWFT